MYLKSFLHHFLFTLAILFCFPSLVSASGVSLSSSKTQYSVGESISVAVKVETGGKSINTVSGDVSFSPTDWDVSEVRYGASIISLWVTKPTIDKVAGKITFVGGVPGGFSQNTGTLFTLVARAKKAGSLSFGLQDIHVLLNDGQGTAMTGLKNSPLSLLIEKAVPKPTPEKQKESEDVVEIIPESVDVVDVPLPDLVSPESFVPLVGAHSSIANNAYFVSFSAVDKDSGVDYFEIKETPHLIFATLSDSFATSWQRASSPFVLLYQHWGTTVSVRAYDRFGNFITETTEKTWSNTLVFSSLAFLILLAVLFTRIWTIRSFRKRKIKKRV